MSISNNPASANDFAWYCLRAQVKREGVAAAGVRARTGLDVFAPTIRVRRKTRSGPKHFVEALFPGYLFVHCSIREHKRHLMAINGVTGFVHFKDYFPYIPEGDIEQMRAQIEAVKPDSIASGFNKGDEVEIVSGPFAQFYARVASAASGCERVALLIEFLGQELNIDLPANDVYNPQEACSRQRIIPALPPN